jgi:hypothetical protein
MLRDFVARNFVAGPSGQRDGRTFDFLQRDALHYHVAAVQPLVEVALYAPDLVDRTTRAAVLSGLKFLKPFFLGHAQHVEFARTLRRAAASRRLAVDRAGQGIIGETL